MLNFEEKISSLLQLIDPYIYIYGCLVDMSSVAFIEPLPVIEFVAQLLGKDVLSRPLSDSNRVKVLFNPTTR